MRREVVGGGRHVEGRCVGGLNRLRRVARADAAAVSVVLAASGSVVMPRAMRGVTDGGRTWVRRLHHPPAEPGGEEQEQQRDDSRTAQGARHGAQATSSPARIKGEDSRRRPCARAGRRARARAAQSRAANTSASTPANQSGVRTSFFTSQK
jgi:hypothetical protein